MKVTEPTNPSIPGNAQKPTVPIVPADHPDLFNSVWLGSSDQRHTPIPFTVLTSPSTRVAPPTAPPPSSISATSPAASAPEASSASSTAPGLDDDLNEIFFPSTAPDPPLTESPEIRQVNTGWLKPHALSVSVYGEALVDKDHGILTPLQVTPDGIVISGHRRLAAAEARLKTVPVFVGQSRGHPVGGIEEQILEANRYRTKNTEQTIREFIAYKMIETARAKERCGCRWDLVPKSAPGEDAMPLPEECIYPLTTLKQDMGKARDLAAKKVGWAGSTAAVGEKVVNGRA